MPNELPDRACIDWIIAYGLTEVKPDEFFPKRMLFDTYLNFDYPLMKKCRKCGHEYYQICVNCEYRNGGNLTGPEDDATPEELCEQFTRLYDGGKFSHARLINQLKWMRIQSMNQWP